MARAGKQASQPEALPLLEGQQPTKKSTLLTVCPFILGAKGQRKSARAPNHCTSSLP